ncbi:LpqN/LpqT family lipoprotein [Mycobacterium sp. MYCO198283]|uniref:LpqN/LpqT family lipoprotein n=1 Tax=Mycobacterium sp. MYCO198283 TaxID=2883505 RepID=UPI001E48C9D2|nr:LpqN/LpqT family lipoprotein [Mycobacterium sp. MYCO198283]MCG5430938.1 LpqN/LpqT family lipoprotein [Mycobacterium sp. MYCO198283]
MTLRHSAAVLVVALAVAGCGTDPPNYQAVWSSSTPTTTSAPKQPISLWLEDQGVTGVPMTPAILTELTVTVPTPAGWASVTDNNIPTAYTILRKTPPPPPGTYTPQALLMVFKLNGTFDVAEALTHADADAVISEHFKRLDSSTDDFQGFPSAMIQGSYTVQDTALQTYNRIVIPTAKSGQRYLVQLTITTAADQAQDEGRAIDTILSGFRIAVR